MEYFKVTFCNAQPVAETSDKAEQKPLALKEGCVIIVH